MKYRLLAAGAVILGFGMWLYGQGVTITDPSRVWSIAMPEPPIPKVAAGESFISVYGHKVTRITDARSGPDAIPWMHFYSDRSALSRNSNYLCLSSASGGATWIQPMNGSMPKGAPYMVYNEKERPISIGQSLWSPADDETLYLIGDGVQLWSYNARTRKKKMIRDFAPEVKQNTFAKDGYLRLQFVSRDAKRFMMDYLRMGKESYGLMFFDLSTNTARMYHGDRIQSKLPVPVNPSFRLVGGSSDKEGEYVFIQENGTPINGSSANPQESSSTYTYIGKWGENPLQGPAVQSLSGIYTTNHGATLSRGHVRVSGNESSFYINNVDWLYALRRADFTRGPNKADNGRFPYRDIFYWPYSTGTGAHISAGGISDDWLAVSIYQETSCGKRFTTPISNEILLLSTKAEAIYDEKNHRIAKNGDVYRLSHHYSYPEDCAKPVPYWGQPHASLSLDGRYVVFTSTFGRTGRTDVFVITLPKHLTPPQQ